MIIDFSDIARKSLPAFKGGEKSYDVKMVDDDLGNKFMDGILTPGASIGMHTHEGNCEAIYILEGCGTVLEADGAHPVKAGMCLFCPDGKNHSLCNTGETDLHFFATVIKQ